MKHNIELKFRELLLKQISPGDLEQLRCWRNDLNKSAFLRKIPYITPELQLKWYMDYLIDSNQIGFSILSNELLIGSVFLYNKDREKIEVGKIQIGDDRAHGKKYCSKCVGMVSMYAFQFLGVNRIILSVNSDNIAAYKSYTRIGFKEFDEAQSPSFYGGKEIYMSLEYYELLKYFPEVNEMEIFE